MSRMKGIDVTHAGLFIRLAYWFTRRKIGQVTGKAQLVEPVKIIAHHPRLLRAIAAMESGQEAARHVAPRLKTLASIKAATRIGCPF